VIAFWTLAVAGSQSNAAQLRNATAGRQAEVNLSTRWSGPPTT